MILSKDLATPAGLVARVVFTDRLAAGATGVGEVAAGPGGSSRAPYHSANLASHVGDDPVAVVANRNHLAASLGLAGADVAFMHPDHGRAIAWVGHEAGAATQISAPSGTAVGSELRNVDAMITAQPGIGLVALAADCVMVLLLSRHPVMVAAVHCGWRGVGLDVVGAVVAQLCAAGAQPSDISAWLGPAICGSCYPVPASRAAEVTAVSPAAAAVAADGQPALDLRAAVSARLAALGVAVELVGGCTAEDENLYSYRRDGRTGRHGAAIALLPGVGR